MPRYKPEVIEAAQALWDEELPSPLQERMFDAGFRRPAKDEIFNFSKLSGASGSLIVDTLAPFLESCRDLFEHKDDAPEMLRLIREIRQYVRPGHEIQRIAQDMPFFDYSKIQSDIPNRKIDIKKESPLRVAAKKLRELGKKMDEVLKQQGMDILVEAHAMNLAENTEFIRESLRRIKEENEAMAEEMGIEGKSDVSPEILKELGKELRRRKRPGQSDADAVREYSEQTEQELSRMFAERTKQEIIHSPSMLEAAAAAMEHYADPVRNILKQAQGRKRGQ